MRTVAWFGAIGSLLQPGVIHRLRDAIGLTAVIPDDYTPHHSGFRLPADVQELAHEPAGPDPDALTPREAEVLRQLALGRTNRQIAEALIVGDETVKTHVGNILAKLHLAHRTQAMIYALKQGLVSVEGLNTA